VHGVAFGPSAFAAVARDLARDRRVILVHRRGYGRSPAAAGENRPEDQAAEIVALLDRLGLERVTALGVSGGATVLTAMAIAAPGRLEGVVLHEPALGPLAPGVHALIGGLGRAVAAAASDAAGAEVVAAALAGPGTWGALGAAGRAEARRAARTVCREVPWFARFAPTPAELAVLRGLPVVASTGERSGPERREAAGVLVRLAGARTALIPRAANLAHLENPAALADLVRRLGAPAAPKEER
jgi:pimeloyl-ACP methyl ester carboxylesterase